jgi:hypothetical protein
MPPYTAVTREPSATVLVTEGLSRVADGVGLVLLAMLGGRMFFGFDSAFEGYAFMVGAIGLLSCWTNRAALKNIPVVLVAYVAIGLLSAAVHRWTAVAASVDSAWWSIFTPASHLVVMAVFIYGTAHLLRTGSRLTGFVVLMVLAVAVLAIEIAFDRVSAGFVYVRGGPSLPSAPHWGGIHGTSLLLTLALPMASAGILIRRSIWQVLAGAILACGFLVVGYLNGSRGGLVAMGLALTGMAVFAVANATRRSRQPLVLGGVAVVGIALAAAIWLMRGRLERGEDLSGRTLMWDAAWRLIAEHPWLGVGPGNYYQAIVSGGYADSFQGKFIGFSNAHNLWLHVGAELGVFGVLCLSIVMLWALRVCWRRWTEGRLPMVAAGLLFALFGFMAHSLTENFLDARVEVERTRLVVWLVLAAVLALERLRRRATPPT